MADIRPFKAVRPVKDKVHLVASRSYVSYPEEKLKNKLDENPFTFIHIINPDHGRQHPSPKASIELFRKIGHRFNEFLDEGVYIREVQPAMYLYKQDRGGVSSIGIVAAVSNQNYRDGEIKKHEQTIERREELFAKYLNTVNFNAEPVLLCHENNEELEIITRQVMGQDPEYDFTTTDRVRHTLWVISDPKTINSLETCYQQMDALYIADGHHRCASSAKLSEMRGADAEGKKDHAVEHFMAYIIPSSSLNIHGFHRVIKDLNGLSSQEFIEQIKSICEVEQIVMPELNRHKGMMDMYLDGKWWRIDASSLIEPYEPDSSWLTNNILAPLLDIKDLRTDKRIKFRPGSQHIEQLVKAVDNGDHQCLILMHPVAFSELKYISDAGGIMPPKSTWIEPKLRSGLTIFTFLEQEKLTE
ncbi:MAG: DUF1015 domain-containing protein [Flavobacteriales bacterium]|nr:DUF1015 domain-containing protein [Flavobacteriales bacterium]